MLIINAKIMTMEDKNYDNGYILIEGKKIVAVGDMSGFYELKLTDTNTIDAMGKLALPGFIDCHCHIGMCGDSLGFEGNDVNEATEPLTPHLRAIDAIDSFDKCFKEAVSAGVTTVLTGPGSANPVAGEWLAMKTYGERIDDMVMKSPVGMKFALGENPKMIYNEKSQAPVTRMATAALIREQLKKAKNYMEKKAEFEEDEEADEPEFDMKCEALLPVLKREIKAFFHAHRADDIFTAVRIAKEFYLDYVLVHCTEGHKIAKSLKEENAKIITGPIICDRSKPELRGLTTKNTALLFEAGLETAICTDHPETPIQYLALSAAIACREGLPYDEALRAITINAAKNAGIESMAGSIAIGKDADILLFDGDPLNVMVKPFLVIAGGEVFNQCLV